MAVQESNAITDGRPRDSSGGSAAAGAPAQQARAVRLCIAATASSWRRSRLFTRRSCRVSKEASSRWPIVIACRMPSLWSMPIASCGCGSTHDLFELHPPLAALRAKEAQRELRLTSHDRLDLANLQPVPGGARRLLSAGQSRGSNQNIPDLSRSRRGATLRG